MSRLIVMGGGGHGRVVADTARKTGLYDAIVFLDNAPDTARAEPDFPVVGSCGDLDSIVRPGDRCIVAIGDNRERARLLRRVEELGHELAVVVDPSASISEGSALGTGTVVLPQAAVNIGSVLGRGCIVNTGATIDHDCRLGDFVHVAPGAHLGGDVSVGDGTWIGIGSSVRHGIEIGSDAMIGAGAAVVASVADGSTVTGVPARPIDEAS